MTQTMIDKIRTEIDKVAGGPSARLDDLIEQLMRAERKSTAEDIAIDLTDSGETEAVEIIRANY